MRLQEVLNKFTNDDFLITVDGMCDELPFWEFESVKTEDYWKHYKNREIKGMAILITNEMPELCIRLKDNKKEEVNL